MSESRAWIIPVFLGLMILVAVLPWISRMRRQKRFSGGIQDKIGEPRYYQTPATREQIAAAFSQRSETDVFEYFYDADVMTLTVFREKKPFARSFPRTYSVRFLPKQDEKTVFCIMAVSEDGKQSYDMLLNEFLAVKLNAGRIAPPADE